MIERHLYDPETGTIPLYAWPGGYPLIYLAEDGGYLCSACVSGENGSECETADANDKQWHIIGREVFLEGPPYHCDHCNGLIESAYGEDE